MDNADKKFLEAAVKEQRATSYMLMPENPTLQDKITLATAALTEAELMLRDVGGIQLAIAIFAEHIKHMAMKAKNHNQNGKRQ